MVETKFSVGMTCDGCANACTRILKKIQGVEEVNCDIEGKMITVTGNAEEQVMLDALLKWSKASGKSVAMA